MASIKAAQSEQMWFHLKLYKTVCVCACVWEREHAFYTHASISISSVNVCACLCMCVPIPFHLIKPWLQQPHTLVCRTQPFITGLEPFTAGFMGASAGPQGHHSRGRGRSGNGEGGSRGTRAEDDEWTERGNDKRRDRGAQSQTGFNLLGDAPPFVMMPLVINIF